MGRNPIDPARLSGEALTRWYLRTPAEVEAKRDQAEAQRWQDYHRETQRQQSGAEQSTRIRTSAASDDDLYVATGSGEWRRLRSGALMPRDDARPSFHPAAPEYGALITVGNPANPGHIKAWEKREGRAWPRDPSTGRPYDVGHIKALADGGADTLDNIEPVHPDAHRAQHNSNGDYSRWGKRASIARAFGGRVARALGPIGILPNITGILSGRIRTDNFDNFTSDMMGWPSQEDRRRQLEREQKAFNPNWKPGDPTII